ncbi:MAG TPA: DUF2917 domain-containing protein [Burkholderiales bacterium]
MNIDISSSTITLAPGSLISVWDGAGTRVLCRSGSLWVTQEGERKDAVVRSGEVLTISRSGRTVISALEGASLALYAPDMADVSMQRQKVRASGFNPQIAACA